MNNNLNIKNLQYYNQNIIKVIKEARKEVLNQMNKPLYVEQKTSRKNLVTKVDKNIEKLFVKKIKEIDPNGKILGEEGFGDKIDSLSGNVWIVDPIDGTMNFIKQKDNFAIMVALYINGKGVLGYIMDVMKNHLYHGGPSLGVYDNDKKLLSPANMSLREGLIGMSAPLLLNNKYNMQSIGQASSGIRIYGSAGIDIIYVIQGKLIGYISHLKPWDFAAGKILGEALGLKITNVDGSPIDMISSSSMIIATDKATEDIYSFINIKN